MARRINGKFKEIPCIVCGETKKVNDANFYRSNSVQYQHVGVVPICKNCVEKEYIDALTKTNDMREAIIHICKLLDKPFIEERFVTLSKRHTDDPLKFYGIYLRGVSCGPLLKKGFLTFEDSVFEMMDYADLTPPKEKEQEQDDVDNNDGEFNVKFEDFKVTDEIINRWGIGYTPEEYYCFEKKYQILKNHYNQQTAMHTEALLTYIRYKVKAELATARNDIKAAKEWGMLADKAANAAKINPVQLSKADLAGGLNTFGELARMVEQVDDIIPILPRFKERPQDSVDFTIWCYVNYIRDLKGLPRVEYSEIYKYIEERKQEYRDKFDFLQEADEEELVVDEDVTEDLEDVQAETGDV